MADSTPARDDWALSDSWRFIPSSALSAEQRQDDAASWAAGERQQLAQQWGDSQRASLPNPVTPPSDSLTNPLGTGNAPSVPPEQAAGASSPPEQSATVPSSSPVAPTPAASTTLPAPNAPVTASLSLPDKGNNQFSPYDDTFRKYAGEFANDPEFIKIVASGTLAESSWNAGNRTGDGGHSWGLFQMHDHGAGAGMGDSRLDPDTASAVMVPKYAAAYAALKDKLSGPALAAAVAQSAERSADPNGSLYAAAYRQISNGNAPNIIDSATQWLGQRAGDVGNAVQGAGQAVQGAAQGITQGISNNSQPGSQPLVNQSPLAPSNVLSGAAQAVSDSPLGQTVKDYYANKSADDKHASDLEQQMMQGPLSPDDQHWLNQYYSNLVMVYAGAGDTANGNQILTDALGDLNKYAPDIVKPITDWAQQALKSGGKASQIGGTIKRWMQENPLQSEAQPDLAAPEMTRLEPEIQGAIGETTPVAQPATDTITGLQNMVDQRNGAAATVADAGDRAAASTPVEQGAVPAAGDNGSNGQPPALPPAPPQEPLPGGDQGPPAQFNQDGSRANLPAGVTDDMVQAAHQRIDQAIPIESTANVDAHDHLDELLARNADPGQIARFFGDLTGQGVTPTSLLRSLRTGSMAGGLSTEGKVALSPVIQVAMRAPVAAVQRIVEGRPEAIPQALQGGLAGLAEGARDALQTIRYGINYRSALTGGAQGGYGFAPGLDVLGSNPLTRTVGTALTGLVRTHGAIADISAGIGRGANAALGAAPAQAAEAGQQWALRSGQYGTIGQAVSNALEGLKRTNPAMDVVGQILVPFYRVAYNAFTQGVERSPLGLGGRIIDAAQGRPLDQGKLANNLFGIGLAGLGFSQAAAGNITGEHPQGGAPKWSVRVPETAPLGPLEALAKRDAQGNLWLPMRALGPGGEALAQATSLYEAARDGNGDVAQTATDMASNYVGHVYDDTWLRSVGEAFSMLGDVKNLTNSNTLTRNAANRDLQYVGGGLVHSVVPQYNLGSQVEKIAGGNAGGTATATRPTRPASTNTRPTRPRR